MRRQGLILSFSIFAGLILNPVSGLNANVSKPVVWTKLDQDVELFCSAGVHPIQSLKICRWTKLSSDASGDRTIIVNSSGDSVVGDMLVGNYSYTGPGMATGECGLKIHNVEQGQIGTWGCTLIGQDIWIGNIEVALYEKPKHLVIHEDELQTITDLGQGSSNISALCCADGGSPIDETHLTFFYGGQPVDSKLHKIPGSVPCISWMNNFTVNDIGKKLKCVVDHPGYSEHDDREVEVLIDVKFPPTFLDIEKGAYEIEFLNSSEIRNFSLIIKGNPKPVIKLRLGTGDNATFAENYSVNITNTKEDNEFEYTILITNPNLVEVTYVLRAENPIGYKEVNVHIVSPGFINEGSGYWTYVIVGVVMSIIFIAIIVYILNYVALKKGWMCYKNRTRKYPVAKRTNTPSDVNEYFTVPRNDATTESVRL